MKSKKSSKNSLLYRSEYLLGLFTQFVEPDWSILEIGSGDDRNVSYLQANGFPNVEGIDKLKGTAIEDIEPKEYDVIFTMSTLFLVPPENNWVFEKIAKMAKRFIVTIEGESTYNAHHVIGRNYTEVFRPFGFIEVAKEEEVFNKYGITRILKRHE